MPQPTLVTAAEISRLAGVTRATVSNWRRRHHDFPAPVGGTETSPTYDLAAVLAWLDNRGQLPATSPADDLRTALRLTAADPTHRSKLLPLVVTLSRLADTEIRNAIELTDARLSTWATKTSRRHISDFPGTDGSAFQPEQAGLLRAVLRCVAGEGAAQTLEVLAEGEFGDGRAVGAYRTPAPIAELMADLLDEPGRPYPERVFDPACGVGALLYAAAGRGARELHGQDLVEPFAAQAAARLAVAYDEVEVRIRVGDSLRDDAFPTLAAEAVLCTPPYGDREWGQEELAYDPRWVLGLPPKGESELAWLQHCLAHLAPGGRAVLLMPPGAAARPSGRRIRAELVRGGVLRAVIALPVGVAHPLHIGLQLWLLQRPHPHAAPPSTVLMLDTTAEATDGDSPSGRRVTDWPALRRMVRETWHDFLRRPEATAVRPGLTRAVPVIDLLDEAVDLSPARHVRAAPAAANPAELAELADGLRSRLRRAATALATLGDGPPWPAAGTDPRPWRHASVADLLRGNALTLLRAPAYGHTTHVERPGPTGSPTLTVRDVLSGRPASGAAEETPGERGVTIEEGDVILPEMLRGGAGVARVADADDAGAHLGRHLYLLRPDPTRLDPWFLAGFLAAEHNLNAASSGTTVVRVDPRRLRVPLLPLAEQRRYGHAFRQLHALRIAADATHRLAGEAARTLAAGLTGGALLPPDHDELPSA